MVYALHKFKHYLLGKQFVFYVNHMGLVYLINKAQVFGRIVKVTHPQALWYTQLQFQGENNERIMSWGTVLGSQHFGGRGPCGSFKMGTRMNDKWVNYSHKPTQIEQQVD
jgi:hypothetical protein